MKKEDFDKACWEVPLYMARFRITSVPPWMASTGVVKGDMYLYHHNGVMIPEKRPGDNVHPYPSHFEFVGYVRVKETGFKCEYEIIEEKAG